MDSQPILEFWFVQCTPKMWFRKNRDFDALIKDKFFDTIYGYYCDGNNRVYQWELQKELKFLNYIKDCGEYTLEDADKLNSITNLYNHIKNGTISKN